MTLSICLCSCKKYLNKKPDTRLATPETLEDCQAVLDNAGNMNVGWAPSFLEATSDDYFLLQKTYDAIAYPTARAAYTWSSYNYSPDNDWKSGYTPIYPSNICLDALKSITRSNENSQKWDNIRGSALFYRAYFFLCLCWTYAKAYDENSAGTDLGIALRLNTNSGIPSVRASVKQCYEQIINDVKEAVQYLPDISIHPFRPSKAAAYGLLARTYLSMRQYENAFKYADNCLKIRNDLMDYNGDPDITGSINGSSLPFRRFNKETIFYTEMTGNFNYVLSYQLGCLIDTTLYSSYNDNDLRKSAFFGSAGVYHWFKGNYAQNSITTTLFNGIATDEMFLIRSECYAQLKNKQAAMDDLNTLLIKRWKNTVPYQSVTAVDNKEALDKIKEERRKELLMRGLRWMDLKRYNKEGAGITLQRVISGQLYKLLPNDNKYALPLPQDIIDITGMSQNIGW
jgi:tetratricopeptide (TPR) repeat protein